MGDVRAGAKQRERWPSAAREPAELVGDQIEEGRSACRNDDLWRIDQA
jgi:hypothetical protein